MAKQTSTFTKPKEQLNEGDDPILSLPEIGRQLNIPPALIYGLTQFGLLKPIRIDGNLRGVRRSTVNRLLEGSESERRLK